MPPKMQELVQRQSLPNDEGILSLMMVENVNKKLRKAEGHMQRQEDALDMMMRNQMLLMDEINRARRRKDELERAYYNDIEKAKSFQERVSRSREREAVNLRLLNQLEGSLSSGDLELDFLLRKSKREEMDQAHSIPTIKRTNGRDYQRGNEQEFDYFQRNEREPSHHGREAQRRKRKEGGLMKGDLAQIIQLMILTQFGGESNQNGPDKDLVHALNSQNRILSELVLDLKKKTHVGIDSEKKKLEEKISQLEEKMANYGNNVWYRVTEKKSHSFCSFGTGINQEMHRMLRQCI